MKYLFPIYLVLLLLLSCNNAEQKQPESSTKTPVEVMTAPDSIATLVAVAQEVTNTDTLPALPTKNAQKPKVAPKKKPDNKAPTPSKKPSNNLAEENSPQKVIGNQYFEVTGGKYCNDDFRSNPRSPQCMDCRFCREVMISVICNDTLYFKKMWAGGYINRVDSKTIKGRNISIYACAGHGPEYQKSPSPIPYQGQALIGYTVGSPDAEIQYFDVTNLRKACRRFNTPLVVDPK